eukprot:jgi/Mesvir1/3628/Mv04365-RA.1
MQGFLRLLALGHLLACVASISFGGDAEEIPVAPAPSKLRTQMKLVCEGGACQWEASEEPALVAKFLFLSNGVADGSGWAVEVLNQQPVIRVATVAKESLSANDTRPTFPYLDAALQPPRGGSGRGGAPHVRLMGAKIHLKYMACPTPPCSSGAASMYTRNYGGLVNPLPVRHHQARLTALLDFIQDSGLPVLYYHRRNFVKQAVAYCRLKMKLQQQEQQQEQERLQQETALALARARAKRAVKGGKRGLLGAPAKRIPVFTRPSPDPMPPPPPPNIHLQDLPTFCFRHTLDYIHYLMEEMDDFFLRLFRRQVPIVTLAYEDLVKDPREEVRRVYEAFTGGLEGLEEAGDLTMTATQSWREISYDDLYKELPNFMALVAASPPEIKDMFRMDPPRVSMFGKGTHVLCMRPLVRNDLCVPNVIDETRVTSLLHGQVTGLSKHDLRLVRRLNTPPPPAAPRGPPRPPRPTRQRPQGVWPGYQAAIEASNSLPNGRMQTKKGGKG